MNQSIQLKTITSTLAVAVALLLVHSRALAAPSENTSFGIGALPGNTGFDNTAIGFNALNRNISGNRNTASGDRALFFNTTGIENTATGDDALQKNTTGVANTASGNRALEVNTTGRQNTASGDRALFFNTTGDDNTATGVQALGINTTGSRNTAIGDLALTLNDSGSRNVAIGSTAGANVRTANNVICIGADVFGANVSNTTWVGNVFGVTPQSGTTAPVIVSNGGQLGTVTSSERFKKDIAPMDKASEAILSLRPVTFHYKTDTEDTPQFGLIAEEVAKANPALVLPDKEGKPYSVRYDAVNAMLLNEFLKTHRKIQELEASKAQEQKQIEALTAGLQKVSAQVEMSKAAPQVAAENP